MNQFGVALLVGLLAGGAGGLGVHLLADSGATGGGSVTDEADLASINARLERIEAALDKRGLTSAPTLRGTAPAPDDAKPAAPLDERFEALAARLEERLKPVVAESVQASMKEVMAANEEALAEEFEAPAKRKATLAEVAAELELSREEEEAVRRIARESTDAFFELLAGKDGNAEDVKREFEEAKNDPKRKSEISGKYMAKALGNFGGLITIGLEHQRKMKAAVGAEKADKIESGYQITDIDPYGLEDMFDFD